MKSRYFFAIAVVLAMIGLGEAVAHQRYAGSLATAVLDQDNAGLDTTVAQHTLSTYAHQHMGVSENLFLAGSYNRAVQAAQAAANPASNGAIYAQAQAACAGHADSITQANCVQAYVNSHSQPSSNPQAVATPSKSAYIKSFSAPGWTPDSAGIDFLAALVAAAMGGFLVMRRR